MIARSTLGGLCVAGALLAGCSTNYSFDLTTQPHGATVNPAGVRLTVGNAIGVTPLENDDPIDLDVAVELVSTAPHIMDIAPSGDPSEFVMWGLSAGVADVEVILDGQLEGLVEVEVLPR
jgi:hypothetical protein